MRSAFALAILLALAAAGLRAKDHHRGGAERARRHDLCGARQGLFPRRRPRRRYRAHRFARQGRGVPRHQSGAGGARRHQCRLLQFGGAGPAGGAGAGKRLVADLSPDHRPHRSEGCDPDARGSEGPHRRLKLGRIELDVRGRFGTGVGQAQPQGHRGQEPVVRADGDGDGERRASMRRWKSRRSPNA